MVLCVCVENTMSNAEGVTARPLACETAKQKIDNVDGEEEEGSWAISWIWRLDMHTPRHKKLSRR